MPGVAQLRVSPALLVALLIPALAFQGCFLSARQYPVPPPPLRPTIVGIVADVTIVNDQLRIVLTDGRTFDEPERASFARLGGTRHPGDLYLARSADPGFADVLYPAERTGCWEAWQDPIVWDMGDSIGFSDGLELPKASSFRADPQSTDVDGRLAWTVRSNGIGMSFCANSQGQIESGDQL